MYICLIGAVDSGKTTFYKKYTAAKVFEKEQRTEHLRFYQAKINDRTITLIDVPGHDVFSEEKKIALKLCDAVIYMTDCANPSWHLLDLIWEKKPTLVLANKWDTLNSASDYRNLSIRDMLQDNSKIFKFYKDFQSIKDRISESNVKNSVVPFFDLSSQEDMSNYIPLFPISLNQNMFLKQFEKYLTEFFLRNVKSSTQTYLYLESISPEGPRFYCIGNPTTSNKDLGLRINSETYLFKDLKYNKDKKWYVLKHSDFNSQNCKLFKLVDVTSNESSITSDIEENLESRVPLDLKNLIRHEALKNLKWGFYAQNLAQRRTLQTIISNFELKPDQYVFLKTDRYSLDKDFVKICLYDKIEEKTLNNQIKCASVYNLFTRLTDYLREVIKIYENNLAKQLLEFSWGEILPEYIFKNQKRNIIAGIKLKWGTLKLKQNIILSSRDRYNPNRAEVNRIEYNRVPCSRWIDLDKNPAIALELDHTYDPLTVIFYSEKLPEFLKSNLALLENIFKKRPEYKSFKELSSYFS
jgi:small GTP-binding protein